MTNTQPLPDRPTQVLPPLPPGPPAEPPVTWVGASAANHFNGRDGHHPQLIVTHEMQGSAAGTRAAFANPSFQASTNYGIGLDGTIEQYVALSDAPFANGPIRNPNRGVVPLLDAAIAAHINPNYITVAVEWEGHHEGTWVLLPDGASTLHVTHWWTPTPAQWASGVALYRWLLSQLGVPADRGHLCRHSDFDSVTKGWCPGVGFDLGAMIRACGGHV